jgi:hypothetical protein
MWQAGGSFRYVQLRDRNLPEYSSIASLSEAADQASQEG